MQIQTIRRYDPPLIRIADVLNTPAFRQKQLLPEAFSEQAMHLAIQERRPYLATGAPVTYQASATLPSGDELLQQLRATLGRTIDKVFWQEGKLQTQSLYVKAVLDTWNASATQFLPADQLVNIINGQADAFVNRFAFGAGLDTENALRKTKSRADLRAGCRHEARGPTPITTTTRA